MLRPSMKCPAKPALPHPLFHGLAPRNRQPILQISFVGMLSKDDAKMRASRRDDGAGTDVKVGKAKLTKHRVSVTASAIN